MSWMKSCLMWLLDVIGRNKAVLLLFFLSLSPIALFLLSEAQNVAYGSGVGADSMLVERLSLKYEEERTSLENNMEDKFRLSFLDGIRLPTFQENSEEKEKTAVEYAPTTDIKFKVNYPNQDVISLCLHKVSYDNDNFTVTPEAFRQIIVDIKKAGYTFVDVNDIRNINNGVMKLPKKAAFLGFDDGYKDNHDIAMPILMDEGAKATFFLVSDFVGKPGWMTEEDVRDLLQNGFTIGSHTVDHSDLTGMDELEVRREFVQSKVDLEQMFGEEIFSIAYPLGYEDQGVITEASKYYDVGFIATIEPSIQETDMTINRYGVFRWHTTLNSILSQSF